MQLLVLDTNVIVSALLSPHGKPAKILGQVLNGTFRLCVDERILSEYNEVLLRPKFKFDVSRIEILMRFIRTFSITVTAPPLDDKFIDIADKKFLEVAKFCNAVLVTGNLKHFPTDTCIKSVNEF